MLEVWTGSTQLQGSKCQRAQVQRAPQGDRERGEQSETEEPLPPPLALQKGPISQPPHVPVCWNLSLRYHHRPHHLVYLVVQRQQRFCTISILPKVVKMQAGRLGRELMAEAHALIETDLF